jgi:hypothetical protein
MSALHADVRVLVVVVRVRPEEKPKIVADLSRVVVDPENTLVRL